MEKKDLQVKFNIIKNEKSKEYLVGILSSIVFSKEIFRKNVEIESFLKEIFDIEYLPYVFRSRTTIFARLSKEIILSEQINYSEISSKLNVFFKTEEKNLNKNRNTNNISRWVQGIRNENEKRHHGNGEPKKSH